MVYTKKHCVFFLFPKIVMAKNSNGKPNCTKIDIHIDAEGKVSVEDNGRGIPPGKHKVTGLSTIETVMTTLHAGGKFDSKAYAVSGGLHGVGASVVNALSTELIVEVKRELSTLQPSCVARCPFYG